MALSSQKQLTLQDFEAFTKLPENSEKRFELINGEIIEVPSNPYVSVVAGLVLFFIRLFLRQNDLPGQVTGEAGGFIIDGHVLAPDVAYVQKLPTNKGYETIPPLLAVEVISDPHNNTEQTDLRRKLIHYMRAGVVVWIVDYVARQVEVHTPEKPVAILQEDDVLTLDDILPGFELPVTDIFPTETQE